MLFVLSPKHRGPDALQLSAASLCPWANSCHMLQCRQALTQEEQNLFNSSRMDHQPDCRQANCSTQLVSLILSSLDLWSGSGSGSGSGMRSLTMLTNLVNLETRNGSLEARDPTQPVDLLRHRLLFWSGIFGLQTSFLFALTVRVFTKWCFTPWTGIPPTTCPGRGCWRHNATRLAS